MQTHLGAGGQEESIRVMGKGTVWSCIVIWSRVTERFRSFGTRASTAQAVKRKKRFPTAHTGSECICVLSPSSENAVQLPLATTYIAKPNGDRVLILPNSQLTTQLITPRSLQQSAASAMCRPQSVPCLAGNSMSTLTYSLGYASGSPRLQNLPV